MLERKCTPRALGDGALSNDESSASVRDRPKHMSSDLQGLNAGPSTKPPRRSGRDLVAKVCSRLSPPELTPPNFAGDLASELLPATQGVLWQNG